MKVVAIIQARMGSTRLPGKVMRVLGGQSVLAHVIERVRACPDIDEVIVATTTATEDAAIEGESLSRGARVYRGSEEDVLGRYYVAARQAEADIVIRVTSDCPPLDPQLLCAMLRRFLAARAEGRRIDYLSNTLQRTFPRGLDAEVFGFAALEFAQRGATEGHQREHVTPFIWEQPGEFALEQYTADPGPLALALDAGQRGGLDFPHCRLRGAGRIWPLPEHERRACPSGPVPRARAHQRARGTKESKPVSASGPST